MTRLRVVASVCGLAVAGVVLGFLPASAAKTTRLSPGVVYIDDNSGLLPRAFNPTTKPVTGQISVLDPVGYTDTASKPFTLDPGDTSSEDLVFRCPTGAGGCVGVPVVTVDSPKVVVSLLFRSFGEIRWAHAGDWKRI